MTSISVAMATYNGSRFIQQQLASIAAQRLLPAELIVTDDASSDDTVAIVRAFAKNAPFIVEVHQNPARLGFRSNFMRAISLCRSDVIALCDQDDVWDPAKLERCMEPFTDPEVLLCFHEAWLIDSQNNCTGLAEIYRVPANNPPLSLLPMRNAFGFAMLFRRELVKFADLWGRSVDNLDIESLMAHDQWLFFLASVFGSIFFIDQPLANYRQHDHNTYGIGRTETSGILRICQSIQRSSNEFRTFSVAARARADILDILESRLNPLWQKRGRVAAIDYRHLSRRYSRRSCVYNATSVFARATSWWRMVQSGYYTKRGKWPFGRRAALSDLANLLFSRSFIAITLEGSQGKIRSHG